jgi:predicted nucleic acid-binding protein
LEQAPLKVLVVSDTSPIRALAHLGRLDLLASLFDEVLVPPAVARELRSPRWGAAVEPADIASITITERPKPESFASVPAELDEGESEAIALALERGIIAILIDERDADAAARELGLKPLGVLGLLLQAKSAGLLERVIPLVERLRRELRFRMTDELQDRVRQLAGE